MKAAFWSGFVSSGFSVGTEGYGGIRGRTMIMATVGGTVSEITGGRFANGAVSGAFVHLFNAEARRILKPSEYNFRVAHAALKEINALERMNSREFVSQLGLQLDPEDDESIMMAKISLQEDLKKIGIIGLYGATKAATETYYMNLMKYANGKVGSGLGLVFKVVGPQSGYGFVYDCSSLSNCHIGGVFIDE